MQRKQVHLIHGTRVAIIFALVLLIALTISSFAQAALPAQTQVSSTTEYGLTANEYDLSLCTGEKHQIEIRAIRLITPEGATFPTSSGVSNVAFIRWTDNQNVADFTGPFPDTHGQPDPHTVAVIVGKEAGEANLYVSAAPSIDPITGITVEIPDLRLSVEVVPCYEAYKGTLMSVITKKDVCNMLHPFKVAGSSPGKFEMVTAVFTPTDYVGSNRGSLDGGDYIVIGRLKDSGTETSHGQWEALAPNGSSTDDYLEIHLKGIGILVYDIGMTASDPHPTESLYILEIKLASPHLCPGT